MPYKSETQRRFFNSPAGKAKIGSEEVEHWNKESEGKELPEKVKNTLDKAITACDASLNTIEIAKNLSLYVSGKEIADVLFNKALKELPSGIKQQGGRESYIWVVNKATEYLEDFHYKLQIDADKVVNVGYKATYQAIRSHPFIK